MANPNTDDVIMQAIAYIAPGVPGNTRLAQVGGPVIIQNLFGLSEGKFPALHIEVDRQRHKILGNNVYDAQIRFLITYYDRWDQSTVLIDTIRQQINADIQQIMTNLQHNSSLVVGTTVHAVSIPELELSPYAGELDDRTVPGLTLVKRVLRLWVNVLPYDV